MFQYGSAGIAFAGLRRTWKPNVYWFWGPTGTGKSHTAYQMALDLGSVPYICNEAVNGNWWWDGYNMDDTVIAEDFRKEYCRFPQLLRMLDKYPFQVAIKGGYLPLLARTIIITCAFSPEQLYEGIQEDITQLTRRITEVRYFGTRYVEPEPNDEAGGEPEHGVDDGLVGMGDRGSPGRREEEDRIIPSQERKEEKLDGNGRDNPRSNPVEPSSRQERLGVRPEESEQKSMLPSDEKRPDVLIVDGRKTPNVDGFSCEEIELSDSESGLSDYEIEERRKKKLDGLGYKPGRWNGEGDFYYKK